MHCAFPEIGIGTGTDDYTAKPPAADSASAYHADE